MKTGASVAAYDPLAAENMRATPLDVEYCQSAADALGGADGCLIMTEWGEFGSLDREFDAMNEIVVIDGRRAVSPDREVCGGICW
ncbi:MAG: UDP-glucose 6-dehydrogenase AglM [Candidatus Methanogaster sp.]|nr:MAG: UDP-glucose 6-dehydrogenase AglM [ANME-2 cluster archaeon]